MKLKIPNARSSQLGLELLVQDVWRRKGETRMA